MTKLFQLPESGKGFVRKTSTDYMTWGHEGLIDAVQKCTSDCVERIVSHLHVQMNDDLRVVIGDLNTADGKPAKGHKTHGAGGKNIDCGYFYKETLKSGETRVFNEFFNRKNVPNKWVPGGRTLKNKHPLWDFDSNWLFVLSLLDDSRVTQILVDELYAIEFEAKAKIVFANDPKKLERALKIIQHFPNHDNHFHLTIV